MAAFSLAYWICVGLLLGVCLGADPFANFELDFSYITASPLGVPQQVIAINGKFPGPVINVTTNYNVVVNVKNKLDEDLLVTWSGIQMRRSSWQDGVLGTNCPIPPKWNWTYQFQVKDQIGKTYRIRVHNVGVSTCLNFRIQSHNLLLAETEGYYTSQQNYTSLDIHVGQSYSFLVTMDQNASSDYYIVASARFVNQSLWQRVTGVAVLHYSNSKGSVAGPLPDPPNDFYDTSYSLNQAMSIRQNVTASGARPNPQGSFHYGQINVTDVYILKSLPPVMIDGKLRATYNGISFVNPDTPIRLADVYKVKGDYKLDFPNKPLNRAPIVDRSIINATYKGFIEIILQNNDTVLQTFHLDGYSFFVVGMGYGEWTENNRGSYNRWDAISRSTVQVFAGGWTAVFVSLDNVGVWNLRTENLDRWYLGQETYMRIINPEDTDNKTELPAPDNVLFCGALSRMQKPQKASSASTLHVYSQLYVALLVVFSTVIAILL
ncbi:UNVERIFIED_CONTAM: Monocopper oxidase-like protein SKS1 [Sesamum angustifolium]|uniref:Monocopper oxidase-like protein SKS1 n=1 Tax=Sesamum angustifolium TaxID=2727405 RepID=A0AAW2PUN2_9LAMI